MALVVGVCEGLARWLEPPATQRLAEEELEAAPELAPDELYRMRSHSPGWPPSDRFNRDGVRDRARPVEKLPGVRRIVCLGDSVTYGPDAHASQAYPQALERLLLLGVCLNDLPDLLALRPPPLIVALHRRSALVRRLIGAETRQADAIQDLFGETPGAEAAYARFEEELAWLRRETEADGARLALVVFPIRPQLSDAPPPARPQQRLRATAAREGLGFLDLRAALAPLGETAFLPEDGLHLTADGCHRVAEAVRDAGLLPDELTAPRTLALGVGEPGAMEVGALVARLGDADATLRRRGRRSAAAAPAPSSPKRCQTSSR